MADFIQKINPKGGVKHLTGTGSPEGVVTGYVGNHYLDNANADVYYKASGDNTNTGWTLINGAGGGSSLGTLSMMMTARLSSSAAVGGVAPVLFNTVDNSVDLEGNAAVTLSTGGFLVKGGYTIYLDGFLKSWQNGLFVTFRWYRNSTLIQTTYGADTTANDGDPNTGAGRSAITVYDNLTNALFYLYRTGGSSTQFYNGNGNIASSQITIKAYKK